jgi:L-ascorbate metabolism protein UlaG (beta-lactamase superfamily)
MAPVRITLVRHATLLVELGGLRLLVDPMLDPAGARPAIPNTANELPNPLVELPFDPLPGVDAVLVTHLHQDHFDATAADRLPQHVPVFCQPEDELTLRGYGLDTVVVEERIGWRGVRIARTGGHHGHGELARRLAPVCGFVLDGLYLVGDTVWCPEVEEALERWEPRIAVVNAGEARFLEGEPITMGVEDVREVSRRVGRVVAVHMEAINHCGLGRAALREAVPGVLVPEDGETLEL